MTDGTAGGTALLPSPISTNQLGGGCPVWDFGRDEVLWLDEGGRSILRGRIARGGLIEASDRRALPDAASAVAMTASGDLLLAAPTSILLLRPEGSAVPVARLLAQGVAGRVLHIGATDPRGRFLVSTATPGGTADDEGILALERDGRIVVTAAGRGACDGIAWSGDGTRMHTSDARARRIRSATYDPITGRAGAETMSFPVAGEPRGLCTDTDGDLWVAMHSEGAVHRYSPEGVLREVVAVPAPYPTAVAFAGRDLDTLVVVASESACDDASAAHPDRRIFTVRTGSNGPRRPLWAGFRA